ncbi:TIGR01777 family oxidoreductase [Paludisphaera mucosa]|uniref:TIGR01777 family oxidoreductase n=1 Tax=Paludisphaera mucosa TaxID=3030827 RepID=A0ABT6F685_9BACT|nr:TIGR01777 family oxidoreductase [Paludisphaera mucosa]MDG3003011.1 TIGR01777 family oxidoreductase [Paludisphaera mucosa]
MRVLVTGGSGLIGRRLVRRILEEGGRPVVVSRRADVLRRERETRDYEVVQGDPTEAGRWQDAVDGCDAVVNLVGHNLFAERWTSEMKRKIRDSRVYGTENVVAAISAAKARPRVLVQGSAVGYYGPRDDEELDESAPSGSDFLAVVCREWEDASAGVEALGVRRAVVRIGVVLAPGEGALKIMTPLFKLGPGVPVGGSGGLAPARGRQWMSWIHIDDIVGILLLALQNPEATGPINGVGPHPVRNAEFARTLSGILWKPYAPWRVFLPFGPPDLVLRLILGEVADAITRGQKVLPRKAMNLGYVFRHPDLAEALADVFGPATTAVRDHDATAIGSR